MTTFYFDKDDLDKIFTQETQIILVELWKGEKYTHEIAKILRYNNHSTLKKLVGLEQKGLLEYREDFTLGTAQYVWNAKFDKKTLRKRYAQTILRSMFKDWNDELSDMIISEIKRRPKLKKKVKEVFPSDVP